MRVMALDTTSRAGSVALVEDGRVVDERAGDASRTHGERLPGELAALGLDWPSIDLFAVAAGPGSFTGLRIGIATIQGLALVSRRPAIGVSALVALAQLASRGLAEGATVAAWIDAQRGEVFSALYQVAPAAIFAPERLVELEGPAVASPLSTLAAWSRYDLRTATFCGDGAERYRQAIGPELPEAGFAPPSLLAGAIGCLGAVGASRGQAVPPAGIRPLYIRRPDAEIHRDRHAVR